MGAAEVLLLFVIIPAGAFFVLYFIIKKAVKDGTKELRKQSKD